LLTASGQNLFSQEQVRKISGLVSSSDDRSPIEGVTVKAKVSGRMSGTQADGIYYISVSPLDSVLIFSCPGYTTTEATISKSSEKNIELARSNETVSKQLFINPNLSFVKP
jgi:hypothetical protein